MRSQSDHRQEHRDRRRGLIALAAAMLVTLLARPGMGQCEYEVTVLRYPIDCGAGDVQTWAAAINRHGHVVGRYWCPLWEGNRGFLWTPERGFQSLEPPVQDADVWPSDINDHGIICGTFYVDFDERGFVHDLATGEWVDLGPAVPGDGGARAEAINNSGVVVGQRSLSADPGRMQAFLWDQQMGFTDLGSELGIPSTARDINDTGTIVGWSGPFFQERAYRRTERIEYLDLMPDAEFATALGVSRSGDATGGMARLSGPGIAAYVASASTHEVLGTLPGHDSCAAVALNLSGVAIGRCGAGSAVVWAGGVVRDLSEVAGIDVDRGVDVNDAGVLLAVGEDGAIVSLVLTPMQSDPADVDGDCTVDAHDLVQLLDHWGQNVSAADLDGDGNVGILDLLLLLSAWRSFT